MAAGSICIRNDERGRWHSVWPRCRDIGHLLTLRATRRTLPASRLLLCHRGTNPPPRATLRSVCVCVSVCVQLCAIPCATARPLNDHPQLSPSFTVLRLRDPLLPTLHCSVCIRCWNTFSLSLSLSLSLSRCFAFHRTRWSSLIVVVYAFTYVVDESFSDSGNESSKSSELE